MKEKFRQKTDWESPTYMKREILEGENREHIYTQMHRFTEHRKINCHELSIIRNNRTRPIKSSVLVSMEII